ncbi:MAG TPA: YitT family protein [Pseudogracilibacillus sp.]|nr:YitT family protein [Pseudogracilibacillus sp.]
MFKGIKLKNTLFIILGSAIFSFGIVHFNMQNNLGEGGFTGITLLLYFIWDLNPAVTNILLNLPVFFIGLKYLGKNTFIYTIIGTLSVSIFLAVFQVYSFSIPLYSDMTLAALFAGVFIGIGLGIVFRNGGTTGGVDIIARIVNKYFGWSIGRSMFIFDLIVISTSIITYLEYVEGMYTLVAVYIGARVIDFIQEGAYAARGAMIISNKNSEIAKNISEKLDRGVTIIDGTGGYTQNIHHIIYCVVPKSEMMKLKNLIQDIDPHAFITFTSVHEVLGVGFTLDENRKPLNE